MDKVLLNSYITNLPAIFDLARSEVGDHVIFIILEHSKWKTRVKYPEAENIAFTENGISFKELNMLGPERMELIAKEFTFSILKNLQRLAGFAVAENI